MKGVHFSVVQTGASVHVDILVDERKVTTLDMLVADFECFIAALDKRPVVTVTHGESTEELDYTDQRNLG